MEFDLYSSDKNGSHAMIAAGIKHQNGVQYIQLKNSYADDPNEQGKVLFAVRSLENFMINFEFLEDVFYLTYKRSMMDFFYIEFCENPSKVNQK